MSSFTDNRFFLNMRENVSHTFAAFGIIDFPQIITREELNTQLQTRRFNIFSVLKLNISLKYFKDKTMEIY